MTRFPFGSWRAPALLGAVALAACSAGHEPGAIEPAAVEPSPSPAAVERYVTCYADGTSEETLLPVMDAPSAAAKAGGATSRQALSSCSPIGAQNIAVLYVTWDGATGLMSTKDEVEAAFFGGDPSLKGYWEDASRGRTTATGAVYGPYTLARPYTCSALDLSELAAAAYAAADADVDFTQYTRVVIVSPQGPDSGCAIMGTSQLGCSQKSTAGDGTFMASTSYLLNWYLTPQVRGAALAAHELGHALGLGHAVSQNFGPGDSLAPLGKASFGAVTDYSGSFSVMGNAAVQRGHYSAPHQERLGWLDGRVATVETAGTVHLAPYEAAIAAAPQAVKIRRSAAANEWIYLELRTNVGAYESLLNPLAFTGLVVHQQVSPTDTRSYQVDLAPQTTTTVDGVLAFGGTFVDPWTGLSVSVGQPDETGVDVAISYGAPTCTQASPSVTSATTFAATAAGAPTSFTVTIRNNDAATCAPGLFMTSNLRPTGWGGVISPATLVLAPGESGVVTFTVTPAAGAVVGTTSTVTARSYRYGIMGNAYPQVFVCGVSAPPTLTFTASSANVEASFDASFTGTVRNDACGALAFPLTSPTPNTWAATFTPASLSLSPGQTGSFTLKKAVPLSAPLGSTVVDVATGGATATAAVNVTAPKLRLVTSAVGTPRKNKPLTLSAAVTYGKPLAPAGLSVAFVVRAPSGQAQVLYATTNASGVAAATYVPVELGTHSAYSTTTYQGASGSSTLLTFAVSN